MKTLLSTAGMNPELAFRRFCEGLIERIGPGEYKKLGTGAFTAEVEAADIGGQVITCTSTSMMRFESTPTTIRRLDRSDVVFATIRVAGVSTYVQGDQEALQRVGDIVLVAQRPTVMTAVSNNQTIVIELQRNRLEGMLGSTRLYETQTIGAGQASTALAASYYHKLLHVHERLNPDTAARMASIGIDLIVASIAERLARDVPKPLHGTILVQRAKAHVEAHLGDPTLDPPRLAAAVGVSLRRLQELFHEHGRHVSDWIWQRRLEVAAGRLADRGSAHVAIGVLAYGCGFVSPSHFGRRFKDRYGMTPSEYRQMAARQRVAGSITRD